MPNLSYAVMVKTVVSPGNFEQLKDKLYVMSGKTFIPQVDETDSEGNVTKKAEYIAGTDYYVLTNAVDVTEAYFPVKYTQQKRTVIPADEEQGTQEEIKYVTVTVENNGKTETYDKVSDIAKYLNTTAGLANPQKKYTFSWKHGLRR
jgi:hypothetical protein